MLDDYNPTQDWYLGKPSISSPLEIFLDNVSIRALYGLPPFISCKVLTSPHMFCIWHENRIAGALEFLTSFNGTSVRINDRSPISFRDRHFGSPNGVKIQWQNRVRFHQIS
uniref:Uncharacterized protein n=1 Tax=Anopheles maculatus TaxID=74869 RepID=A0A182S5F8_9DIPT